MRDGQRRENILDNQRPRYGCHIYPFTVCVQGLESLDVILLPENREALSGRIVGIGFATMKEGRASKLKQYIRGYIWEGKEGMNKLAMCAYAHDSIIHRSCLGWVMEEAHNCC